MLPLPSRRFDPEDVRERLRALASGRPSKPAESSELAEPSESTFSTIEDLLDDDGSAEPAPVVIGRSSLRPVALAIALTALTAWLVVHLTSGGAPSPIELVPGTPMASMSASAGMASAGSGSGGVSALPEPSASSLVVQVLGEVTRPGLVRLDVGSRVADALRAAGGLVRGGSSGGLNLARLIVDGEQIVVSRKAVATSVGSDPGPGGVEQAPVVNLNTATASDLDALPGVGPVMAGRILDWRGTHGQFVAIEQLREISGIGARTFERLKTHVRV